MNNDESGERPFDWGLTPDANAGDSAQKPKAKDSKPVEQPTEPVEPTPTETVDVHELFAEHSDEGGHADEAEALAEAGEAAGAAFAAVPETFAVSELPAANYGDDLSHWTAPTATVPTDRLPAGEAGFAGIGEQPVAEKTKNTKLLWWVSGGLVALVIVVALFFFGSQIPKWIGGAGANPTPTAPVTPTAMATPGTSAWDQLYGGECIDPFTSPWQEEFTVVDCTAEHAAQLVYRGSFPGDASTVFPGEEALGAQINALCTQAGVFDTGAASAYANLQVQGAYPVTAEQWDGGERSFYCFVNRADGSAITGSLAGAGPQ